MSLTTTPDAPATGPESEPDIPPDLDPETHRIIATHFYGVDLREVREVFWNQFRLGYRLPAQSDVIVITGGRRG